MVADLVRQAQSGDAEAYTELVRRFQDAVYAAAYQQVLDADSARDIAQEAFVRAYQALGKLRRPEAFPAWIVRICRNLATDWLRRPERRWVPLDETAWSESDLAATVAARDLVNRALATLPEDNRLALSLFLVNGYTYNEVAALTGAPVSTVKGRIERAKGKLAMEVLSMVEDTLKSGAPDEEFTLETIRQSVKDGWDAMYGYDSDTARAAADSALVAIAEIGEKEEQRSKVRQDALELVMAATMYGDPERWREAVREAIEVAEARGDGASAATLTFTLASGDPELTQDERDALHQRAITLFRENSMKLDLGQALFSQGWRHISAGSFRQGFAELEEARTATKDEPYSCCHTYLEASAEFERLTRGQLDKERCVAWGASCRMLKVEGHRVTVAGGNGFTCHSGIQSEMAKVFTPFFWLFLQVGWFPYTGPAPGFSEEKSAFSYTPNPTHMRIWIETDNASVNTPSGDFHNCLLLRVTRTESPLDAEDNSKRRANNQGWCGEKWCWFARGVGPVAYRAERPDGIIEHVVLSKFECPEQRDEWVPLVLGTRWEYVPAVPGEDFDTLVTEWLAHVDGEGRWYQANAIIANRREK